MQTETQEMLQTQPLSSVSQHDVLALNSQKCLNMLLKIRPTKVIMVLVVSN